MPARWQGRQVPQLLPGLLIVASAALHQVLKHGQGFVTCIHNDRRVMQLSLLAGTGKAPSCAAELKQIPTLPSNSASRCTSPFHCARQWIGAACSATTGALI